jgi:tRNA (mo5U34)-methyltransferase
LPEFSGQESRPNLKQQFAISNPELIACAGIVAQLLGSVMSATSKTPAEAGDHLLALRDRAVLFGESLATRRRELAAPEFWYPYGSIGNFHIIERLLTGANRRLFQDTHPKRAADIGAADGDVSFFLEQEGWSMTIIDHPPTNWNGLRGAKLYKEATGSAVQIREIDLDSQFVMPERYDLVFFMGILYHLKNPFYVLERLSQHTKYAIVSTRIMRWSKPTSAREHGTDESRQLMEHLPVAYLLGPSECNNDSTNYWIFSDAGLRRLLDRTQWDIEDYMVIGATEEADPFTAENDARAFCLIKSRRIDQPS